MEGSSSEKLPKAFEKVTEVLPFTKYGISSLEEFKNTEAEMKDLEWLKKAGLNDEEILLYQQYEVGILHKRQNIEVNTLKSMLNRIFLKIEEFKNKTESVKANTTKEHSNIILDNKNKPTKYYPDEHPMNHLPELEQAMFGHFKTENKSFTKRRKILRRLERKKQKIYEEQNKIRFDEHIIEHNAVKKSGSLWDVKEFSAKLPSSKVQEETKCQMIGPQKRIMYTIRNGKIERVDIDNTGESENIRGRHKIGKLDNNEEGTSNVDDSEEKFKGPGCHLLIQKDDTHIDTSGRRLQEGIQVSIDDIKNIDQFKDYTPGTPSKRIYLRNLEKSVSKENVCILFNQFIMENGGQPKVELMSIHNGSEAIVTFNDEALAITALQEINGTVLHGKPIIAVFH